MLAICYFSSHMHYIQQLRPMALRPELANCSFPQKRRLMSGSSVPPVRSSKRRISKTNRIASSSKQLSSTFCYDDLNGSPLCVIR